MKMREYFSLTLFGSFAILNFLSLKHYNIQDFG
jgi:hypothetical protein